MLNAASLLNLKAELTEDPLELGLTVSSADDEANADKLNLVRETILVRRRSLTTAALFNAVVPLEHQSLSSQQARWLDSVLDLDQIDPFANDAIVSGVLDLFSEESESRSQIEALLTQPGNRVTQLFQLGQLNSSADLTPSDVANARAAT